MTARRRSPEIFQKDVIHRENLKFIAPPGYPIFIAMHYIIFGESPEFVILSQNIIDALKIFLIYRLSTVFGLVGNFSLIPSVIYAVSPIPLFHTQALMTEPLQSFLILVFVIIVLSAPKLNNAIFSGVVLGLLSLIHPLWYAFGVIFPSFIFSVSIVQ